MVAKKLGKTAKPTAPDLAVPQIAESQSKRTTSTQQTHRHPHVLNASTNLLAICFVIIGGLKLTDLNAKSYSDETAWVAAALLFTSTACSYLAIRNNDAKEWQSSLADGAFLGGLCALMLSMFLAALIL